MTTGTISGEINSGHDDRRAGNFGPAEPDRRQRAEQVASTVAPAPMNRLLPMASRQRGVPKHLLVPARRKPASGNVKNDPLLKDSGTGTKIGTTRKTSTSTHQSHSARDADPFGGGRVGRQQHGASAQLEAVEAEIACHRTYRPSVSASSMKLSAAAISQLSSTLM